MKVYVVNLPKDKHRAQHIVIQLGNAGLNDYEFVPGVIASEMSEEELREAFCFKKSRRFFKRSLTMPQIGCAIAHYNVWKLIAGQAEPCIVLEDDVELLSDFKRWAYSLSGQLGTSRPWVVNVAHHPGVIKRKPVVDGMYPLSRPIVSWGTSCYIMTPGAAARMVKQKPWAVADSWLMYEREFGIEVYGGKNLPAVHRQVFESNITPSLWDKTWPMYKKLFMAVLNMLTYRYDDFLFKIWYPYVRRGISCR